MERRVKKHESILQSERQCYVCGSPRVQEHHVYGGARRKLSDACGCIVFLCREHHTGDGGVHFDPRLSAELKSKCQEAYEERWTDFVDIFGRNYR